MVNTHCKVAAIIPARGGSKSIPRKNIKLLGGLPLLTYSIVAGRHATLVDRVIVSTDDPEIAEISRAWGAEVPFIRPAELAGDEVTDLPVFIHVLDWLKENEAYVPDVVVQLRPTSPLRPKFCVDEAISMLINNHQADSVRSVTPSGQNPFKMWQIRDGLMVPLLGQLGDEMYNMPRQKLPATYWQTGHIEAIRSNTILKDHTMTGASILPYLIPSEYVVDLDNLDQWRYAEYLIQSQVLEMISPALTRNPVLNRINLIVLDFDGVMTDNKVRIDERGKEAVICDRADGLGLAMLRRHQLPVIVLSTEENPVVAARCKKLDLSCVQGIQNKAECLQQIMAEMKVSADQVAYVGNDLNDADCMKIAGWAVAVADAHPTIKGLAHWILTKRGGDGAVRELCELFIASKEGKS